MTREFSSFPHLADHFTDLETLARRCLRLTSRRIANALPPFDFLALHYAYFIFVSLLSSLIFWGASNPARSVSYTDSLFMCVSAITGAGLNSVCYPLI
jgi:hypothetical protein